MSTNDTQTTASALNAEPIEEARKNIFLRQAQYAKARGSKALATMIVDAFVTIEKIIRTTSVDDQVLILSAYQIKPAILNVSPYSPWIAVCWGEPDHTVAKVDDLNGIEHPRWRPDANMKIYHHTMEHLHEQGFSADSDRGKMIDHIMQNGGSQTVANKRKQGIADADKPGLDATNDVRRDLYLKEGPRETVDLSDSVLALPKNAGRFVAVVLERTDDGHLIYRGLASKDANGVLTKLASDAYEGLLKQRDQRNVLNMEVERARREAREEVLAEVARAG